MIRFSIIISNYNHAAYLRQRIDSVLRQTFTNFEVILIDDASTDASRTIIESYRDHPLISNIIYQEKNSGSAFIHWQTGIHLAKNDWIWIAEADDIADPDFLKTAVDAVAANPSAGLFYCNANIISDEDVIAIEDFAIKKNKLFGTQKWNSSYLLKGLDEITECLQYDCTVNNISSMVFKKELATPLLPELGRYKYFGDWFFILKLCFRTDIYYSQRVLNSYRKHSESNLHKNNSRRAETREYFQILKLLYYDDRLDNKKSLLDHFSFHYLGFSLTGEGLLEGLKICRQYIKLDKKIGWRIIWRWILLRLSGGHAVKSAFPS